MNETRNETDLPSGHRFVTGGFSELTFRFLGGFEGLGQFI